MYYFIICHVDGGFMGIISEACIDNKFDLGNLDFDLRQPALWTVLIASFLLI